MFRPDRSPVAMAMLAIFLIGFHFALICVALDLAIFRASLTESWFQIDEVDQRAIEVAQDRRRFVFFALGNVLILALVPLLVRLRKDKPWIGALIALTLGGFSFYFYGQHIIRISAKVIDWRRVGNDP